MTVAGIVAWATVALGAVVFLWCVRSTLYFRNQVHLAGRNWIAVALFRTAGTITAVAGWLTLARAISLTFGPQLWATVISGLTVLWLLSIPILLARMFRAHEGRE